MREQNKIKRLVCVCVCVCVFGVVLLCASNVSMRVL